MSTGGSAPGPGETFDDTRHLAAEQARSRLPRPDGSVFETLLRHGTLEVEIYAPRGEDRQQPHARDEAYVVISGTGTFACDGRRHGFTAGDLLFAPAGSDHRFEDFTPDFATWVLFYGPRGGERRAAGA